MTYEIKEDADGMFRIENAAGDMMGLDGEWHSQPGDAEYFSTRAGALRFAQRNA